MVYENEIFDISINNKYCFYKIYYVKKRKKKQWNWKIKLS